MIASAPARRMPVSASSTTRRSSIQPCRAAAFTIAYSPLTLYATQRQRGPLPHRPHHVEVGQRRLHHQHVGALGLVQRGFQQRLADVGRVHLVLPPVAERRRAVGGLAERPVEGAGVLHRVAQDGRRRYGPPRRARREWRRTMPSIMPLGATMSAPGVRVAHRDPAENLEGGVVVHAALPEHAAVAVAGVLAAADVGDQQQIGMALRGSGAAPAARCRPRRSSRCRPRPWSPEGRRAAPPECRAPGSGRPPGPAPRPPRAGRRRASSRSHARPGNRGPRTAAG